MDSKSNTPHPENDTHATDLKNENSPTAKNNNIKIIKTSFKNVKEYLENMNIDNQKYLITVNAVLSGIAMITGPNLLAYMFSFLTAGLIGHTLFSTKPENHNQPHTDAIRLSGY